jgi:hypothetical protein
VDIKDRSNKELSTSLEDQESPIRRKGKIVHTYVIPIIMYELEMRGIEDDILQEIKTIM